MFLVSDTLASRQAKIKSFLGSEPAISVLLAAADFEWTIRRAILLLGDDPNVVIRESDLHKASGLAKYERAWNSQVKSKFGVPIKDVLPNWDYLNTEAFPLRHKLIHGEQGTTSVGYAKDRVQAIMAASESVVDFVLDQKKDVYARLEVRPRRAGNR